MTTRPGSNSSSPKDPKTTIARLRGITGLTQRKFAALCGIRFLSYKTLERRDRKTKKGLSERNACQIAAATGVSPENLMRNQLRVLGENRSYTAEDFKQHKRAFEFPKIDDTSSKFLSKDDRVAQEKVVVLRREMLRRLQNRFDEIYDTIEEREGLEFVSGLFSLALDLDDLADKYNVSEKSGNAEFDSTVLSLVNEMQERVPDFVEGRTLGDVWRRWRVESFAGMMEQAKTGSKKDRNKHRKSS